MDGTIGDHPERGCSIPTPDQQRQSRRQGQQYDTQEREFYSNRFHGVSNAAGGWAGGCHLKKCHLQAPAIRFDRRPRPANGSIQRA
jgi:hypothetical protein